MTVAAMQRERPAETRPAHEPVMVGEVIEALAPRARHTYIDCNVGEGGHSEAILKSAQGARVLGIDLDYEALTRASERLGEWRNRTLLHHGNFSEVNEAAVRHEYAPVDGVLFDLGMSSAQLDSAERGFSFTHDGRLDMRFNPDSGVSAHDIVNGWSVSQLEQAIGELGEEAALRAGGEGDSEESSDRDDGGVGERGVERAELADAQQDTSGDADVPGAADGGQRGDGESGEGAGGRGGGAGAGRAAGGHKLSLYRRQGGKEVHAAEFGEVLLPYGAA